MGLPARNRTPIPPTTAPVPSHQSERYSIPRIIISNAHSGRIAEIPNRISALTARSALSTGSAIGKLSSGSRPAVQIAGKRFDRIERGRSFLTEQRRFCDEAKTLPI
jgi:hypothetical protein